MQEVAQGKRMTLALLLVVMAVVEVLVSLVLLILEAAAEVVVLVGHLALRGLAVLEL